MKFILENYIYFFIIDDIFKLMSIDFKKVTQLGKGDNGVAYLYDNKVYKITTDSSEVELAYILIGEKPRHYVQIFDIFVYDREDGDNNITTITNNPRYYWVIVQEYLNTKNNNCYGLYDAVVYFDNNTINNFDFSKNAFEKLIQDYKNDIEYNFDEDYEDETLFFLIFIKKLFLDLKKYGIVEIIDLKSTNLGKTITGEFKFFDLRLTKGIDKDIRNIKQLN